jgi:protein MAK11
VKTLPRDVKKFFCAEGELVRWSTTGSLLIVQSQRTITAYSTVRHILTFLPIPVFTLPQELEVLYTLDHASRIHDVQFAQRVDREGEVVFVAAEDKKTTVYEISLDPETVLHPIAYLVGHRNRCVGDTL